MNGRLFLGTAGGVPVTVRVGGHDLVLARDGGSELRWPLDGLAIELGGTDAAHLTFKRGEDQLFLPRAGLAAALESEGAAPWLVDKVKGLSGAATRRWLAARTLLLGIGAALLLGLVVLLATARSLALRGIPPAWEVQAGGMAYEAYAQSAKVETDPELQAFLDETARRLLEGAPGHPYRFELHVIRDPAVNAAAFPGGQVIVNTGLIAEAATPDEVAGVLAHELAHVLRRHTLRATLDKIGLVTAVMLVFDSGSALFELEAALRLADLKFSRDHEREADKVGLELMHAAGLDTGAMSSFFARLAAKGDLPGSLAFLSTHPGSAERAAELAKQAAALEPRPHRPLCDAATWAELKEKAARATR